MASSVVATTLFNGRHKVEPVVGRGSLTLADLRSNLYRRPMVSARPGVSARPAGLGAAASKRIVWA